MVGAKGFEPSTSWSRTRRASQAALRPDSETEHGQKTTRRDLKNSTGLSGPASEGISHFPPRLMHGYGSILRAPNKKPPARPIGVKGDRARQAWTQLGLA